MPSDREGILQGRQSGSAAKLSGLFDEEMLKPVLDDNGQRKMERGAAVGAGDQPCCPQNLCHFPGQQGSGHQDSHEHDRPQGGERIQQVCEPECS